MTRIVLLILLFVLAGPVAAQSTPTYIGGASGGTLYPAALNNLGDGFRSIAANPAVQGETLIADKVRVAVGATTAEMNAVRAISLRSALALGTRLIPLVNTAALVYTIYDKLGCHVIATGQIQCEQGISLYDYANYNAPAQRAASPDGVIRLWLGSNTLQTYSCIPTPIPRDSAANCTFTFIRTSTGATENGSLAVMYSKPSGSVCPGGAAFRPDGLCPGGTALPKTEDEAAGIALPYADKTKAVDIVRQVLQNGIDARPLAEVRPATGPASLTQPQTTKTTTAANGTTQVQTSQITNNITYAGDTYNITNTTITNYPDGSSDKVQETPQKGPCDTQPDSLGCMKLGDLPTDAPTWQTKTITYQPESLGLAGACPAPWTGTVHGWTLSMSYQPACDVAPQIRLGVLALASLGALLMIITTVRT